MRFHRFVGWSAVILSLAHLMMVTFISRGLLGLWLIGFTVLVPGLFMVFSRNAAGSAVGLLSVSLWQLVAFHATFPAIFAIAALIDCVVLAVIRARSGKAAVAAALIMCAFVGGSAAALTVIAGVET